MRQVGAAPDDKAFTSRTLSMLRASKTKSLFFAEFGFQFIEAIERDLSVAHEKPFTIGFGMQRQLWQIIPSAL